MIEKKFQRWKADKNWRIIFFSPSQILILLQDDKIPIWLSRERNNESTAYNSFHLYLGVFKHCTISSLLLKILKKVKSCNDTWLGAILTIVSIASLIFIVLYYCCLGPDFLSLVNSHYHTELLLFFLKYIYVSQCDWYKLSVKVTSDWVNLQTLKGTWIEYLISRRKFTCIHL